MTHRVLPPELDRVFWSVTSSVNIAPKSERLTAFRNCTQSAIRLIGLGLSRAEIADRLYAVALATGIVGEYGEDAVQEILANAFAITDFDEPEGEVDDDVIPPEFSDENLSLQFAWRHRGSIRYIAAWNKWYLWQGTRWVPDETLQALHLVRRHCREIASKCHSERIALVVASKKTIGAVVSLARADRRIAANADQWDRDPWLLSTPSSVVDLRSGKQRPHDPCDYLTKITAVSPDAARPIPIWRTFLNRACRGDLDFVAFLQRILGYSLTGITREHALFFCYGTGANGKSTLINTVTGCLGDYHRTAAIETFTASTNERHPTDLAGLRGARLVTAVETEEGRRWAEAKIKPPTNVLAVAVRSSSVEEYERQFGGKRLVEGTLFYDGDGRLLPPQPDIVIVDDSDLDRAYTAAGIQHRVTSAEFLIKQGYRNRFLLKLAPWLSSPSLQTAPTPDLERKSPVTAAKPDPQSGAPVSSTLVEGDDEEPSSTSSSKRLVTAQTGGRRTLL